MKNAIRMMLHYPNKPKVGDLVIDLGTGKLGLQDKRGLVCGLDSNKVYEPQERLVSLTQVHRLALLQEACAHKVQLAVDRYNRGRQSVFDCLTFDIAFDVGVAVVRTYRDDISAYFTFPVKRSITVKWLHQKITNLWTKSSGNQVP